MTELSFQVGNDPCNKHLREGGGYPWFMHIFTLYGEDKEKINWVFTVIIFSCWIIWKTRCSFVHEGKPIVPSVVINNITNAIREFLGVFESGSLHASRPVVVSTSSSAWQPPPPTGSS